MKTRTNVISRVLAAVKDDALEIDIFGDIGVGWLNEDGITPKSVKRQMDDAGEFARLTVRINSPGGNAFDGVAIYNVLRAPGKPVAVYVDGIAASAASIIAMAGDTITMGKGSMLMLHNPWTIAAGDAKEFRAQADVLDKIGVSMSEIYVDRSGKSKDEVREILEAETWMSAQEAVDQGFATDIAEGSAKALAAAKEFPLLSKLRNVPEELKAAMPAAKPEPAPEAPKREDPAQANSGKAAQSGPPTATLTAAQKRFMITNKRRK